MPSKTNAELAKIKGKFTNTNIIFNKSLGELDERIDIVNNNITNIESNLITAMNRQLKELKSATDKISKMASTALNEALSDIYQLNNELNSLTRKDTAENGSTTSSWITVGTKTLLLTGNIPDILRISYEAFQTGSTTCKVRLYKDDVALGIEHVGTGSDLTESYKEFVEDISGLSSGETLQVKSYGSGGSHLVQVKNFYIKGNTGTFKTT